MFLIFIGLIALVMIAGLSWMLGRWMLSCNIDIKKPKIRFLRFALGIIIVILSLKFRMLMLFSAYMILISAVVEAAAYILKRLSRNRISSSPFPVFGRLCISGLIPLIITALFLSYGYYNMGRVTKTEYTISSDKLKSDYNILLISDTHYDTIQSTELLKEKIHEMNALKPDFVILDGDIADESTSKKSMEEVFNLFGQLKSKYGVFYIYGNHDRQPYADKPKYSDSELKKAIESNGIKILKDQSVTIKNDIVLAGRDDSVPYDSRLSADKLFKNIDKKRFVIVADHRPYAAKEVSALGADLQLSGHTHGGQIFPIGIINEIIGMNYGMYEYGNMKAIVSSGFTGWGFPIRTEGKCEYVLIHLKKK